MKILISAILSLIVSFLIVAGLLELIAVFELTMLPQLILPLIIVWIPAYMFVYTLLFKQKKSDN